MRCWGDDNAPPRGVPRGEPPLGDSLVTFSSGRRVRQSLTPSPLEGRSALLMGRSAEDGAQPLLASFSTDPGRRLYSAVPLQHLSLLPLNAGGTCPHTDPVRSGGLLTGAFKKELPAAGSHLCPASLSGDFPSLLFLYQRIFADSIFKSLPHSKINCKLILPVR